ncbi:MAG: SDR family oxidoreductase [Syntrophorhabdales bacterium]|jgi:NAD(P)-dependent dehydrogenase (short-subunit alcohol dehydrogenase family)
MKDLKGKVIAVTGAGSGIGRALALRLDREGSFLALADRDARGLAETCEALKGTDGCARFVVDVSIREQVYAFASGVVNAFGRVDAVINNAGVSSSGFVHELTYETLEWTINANLWGVIHGTKAFLPHLVERPEANIVNVSSVYGLVGWPGQAAYCASKFAVWGFTEALRQELRGSSVAVTVVFPGGVRTNIAKNSRTDHRIDRQTFEEGVKRMEATWKTSPVEAADAIVSGMRRNAPRVLIGKDARRIDVLARIRPASYDRAIEGYVKRTR